MSSWILGIFRLQPRSAKLAHSGGSSAAFRRDCRLAPLVLALAMAGCGASNNEAAQPPGLQPPTPVLPNTAYVGTSPFDATAPGASPIFEGYSGNGLWSVDFNRSPSYCPSLGGPQPVGCFSAEDMTTQTNNTYSGETTVAGNVSLVTPPMQPALPASEGFLNLNQTNVLNSIPITFPQAGFALEVPGRVAVLRQGDNTMPVTALVPSGCPSINGNTRFNFVALPSNSWNVCTDPAYGSVSIATSGPTWNFSSFQQSTLTDGPVIETFCGGPPVGNPVLLTGTTLPLGTCAPTGIGSAVYPNWDPSILPTVLLSPLPKTIAVGPSGFYLADQGMNEGISLGFPGEFGVIQPSAALNTSGLLSQNYLGFIFEPGQDCVLTGSCINPVALPAPESQLGAFGSAAAAGMAASCTSTTQTDCLAGGGFPVNPDTLVDDPTQPELMNLVIDLGAQSTNGLYPNVSITNLTSGTVYPAVAVAGNPEGKYAVFIIGQDLDNALPISIYLFQQ